MEFSLLNRSFLLFLCPECENNQVCWLYIVITEINIGIKYTRKNIVNNFVITTLIMYMFLFENMSFTNCKIFIFKEIYISAKWTLFWPLAIMQKHASHVKLLWNDMYCKKCYKSELNAISCYSMRYACILTFIPVWFAVSLHFCCKCTNVHVLQTDWWVGFIFVVCLDFMLAKYLSEFWLKRCQKTIWIAWDTSTDYILKMTENPFK